MNPISPELKDSEPYTPWSENPTNLRKPQLTKRELEVLNILGDGGRNKDIAAEMTVSLHTVKFHIENLYIKLNVRTRAELIRVATRSGYMID